MYDLIQWGQDMMLMSILMFVISTIFVVALIWVCLNVGKFSVRSNCEGCIMIVDVPDYRTRSIRLGTICTFHAPKSDPTLMKSSRALGLIDAQNDSRFRISLIGKWERVDEFTIREILSPEREANARKYDYLDLEYLLREYKVGQSFPFRSSSSGYTFLTPFVPCATVVQLYIPSDDAPSDGDKG